MKISFDPGSNRISTGRFSLLIQPNKPFLLLSDSEGLEIAELFPFSSVHTAQGLDDTTQTSAWEVTRNAEEILLECNASSSIWQNKRYRLRCTSTSLHYWIEVEGEGNLTEVDYFGGYCSSSLRWGSGYFESGNSFLEGFTPEPNTREAIYFPASSSERIDLTGVPIPGRDGWFFTPSPFCFCFRTRAGWLSAGVEASPLENRFSDYQYQAGDRWFHFTLAYDGMTRVHGSYSLPMLSIYFADDPYDALKLHAEALRERNWAASSHPGQTPAWWREPIFCGWGAQSNLASKVEGWTPDFATQDNYNQFLAELDMHGINPGTVVIDDKWQQHYGENSVDPQKWPDMGGFVREQHERDRKVLLWLKFWDPDGLPADECITNAGGAIVAVDPTNPKFITRFTESIRYLLASESLNGDGFKVDFSARIPCGPGMRIHQDVWGLELMKTMLKLLYTTAKAVKPDALIITHTPHPYLAPYLDMIRLNDINRGKDLIKAMVHRQKVARIACPDALIDTDNWPITNKADWLAYLDIQSDLGVPALYYSSEIDATHEKLTTADYARLRNQWKRYTEERSIHENNTLEG
jgi:hypothetical protein